MWQGIIILTQSNVQPTTPTADGLGWHHIGVETLTCWSRYGRGGSGGTRAMATPLAWHGTLLSHASPCGHSGSDLCRSFLMVLSGMV